MKRITIKDLSKTLNISTSTVSRALSDHPDISSATKEKVKLVAEQLNYTTNHHARIFRSRQSGLVALILPELNMFFTPSLIQGINKTIDSSKYSLITFFTNDKYEREKEMIQQCLHWAVEGVLISVSSETENLSHLEAFKRANIKCVMLDKTIPSDTYPSVIINSVDASYKAVSHLIENGHKNILGIFGNRKFSISKNRIDGYSQAMIDHNLPLNPENIISVENSDDLDFILPIILRHNRSFSAIFTMSDELLAKILLHVNKQNLSIPEDISIVSISDGVYPYLNHPNITHVKDSGSKMGKTAAKLLLDCILTSEEYATDNTYLDTKLVELNSVSNKKEL